MTRTCPDETLAGVICGGEIVRTVDDGWVYFRCQKETDGSHDSSGPVEKFDKDGQRHAKLERAGLPPAFFGKTLEGNPDNRNACRTVTAWLADLGNGALPAPALYGLNGRGKSHLLTAICERLINEHDKRVLFRSSRQLLRELRDFENKEQLWQRLITVDVLALDDLGAEQQTEWRFDQLGDLLDERYQRELPVLVATNFKPEAWERRFTKRIGSRLHGMCVPVELGGVDRRQERMEVAA